MLLESCSVPAILKRFANDDASRASADILTLGIGSEKVLCFLKYLKVMLDQMGQLLREQVPELSNVLINFTRFALDTRSSLEGSGFGSDSGPLLSKVKEIFKASVEILAEVFEKFSDLELGGLRALTESFIFLIWQQNAQKNFESSQSVSGVLRILQIWAKQAVYRQLCMAAHPYILAHVIKLYSEKEVKEQVVTEVNCIMMSLLGIGRSAAHPEGDGGSIVEEQQLLLFSYEQTL